MALSDFFADTTSGSWADDMDLPTAPAPRENTGPKRGEPGYLDSMPDRSARQGLFPGAPSAREEVPLPTVPPYTAYIGNLSFDDDVEEQVREFFGDLSPISVRIIKDPTGKPKGYGYVEFPTLDGLKESLTRSMAQLQGRTIRVNVAEPPSTSRREFQPSAAEEASQWRRTTPLPSRTAEAPSSTGARRPQTSSFGAGAEPGPERDWGAARGARFTPAPPIAPSAIRRDSSGAGRVRDFPVSTHADEVDQWRSNKPLAEARGGAGRELPPHQRGGPVSDQGSPSLAETEQTWSRATKLRAPVEAAPTRSSTASPGEDKDWRSARATPAASRQGSVDGESPRQAPPAPLERRKLQLAPRSVPATPSTATSSESSPAPRTNIFGAAKPIDSAAKEKAAEEKLAARDEERRKAREAEIAKQKEDAEKGRLLAEEKAKSIKAAQEKAKADFEAQQQKPAAPQRQSSNQQQQPKRVHPSRKASNEVKSPKASSSPVVQGQTKDEEGFESVQAGRKGSAAQIAAAQEKEKKEEKARKDSTTRPSFSFAAAAMSEGFVEGQEEDEAVESVTKSVAEVKV
ncbi:hypothetical protein IAR55_006302 [Kwoniella newhampshirensis]|uniref:RRM domain-containing protein n=1 Tax=Kwoniella newhampshirensis TaxID=1651941 RepID=A0AAW0YGP7_9TREE